MSSGDDKIKFYLRFDGEWVQGNNGWDYVNCSRQGVKLAPNVTYRKFVRFAEKKAVIDSVSVVGETQLIALYDGAMIPIADDVDASAFLEYARRSDSPPSVIVCVNSSTYEPGHDEDDVVAETQEVEDEEFDDDEPSSSGFHLDESYVFSQAGLGTTDDDEGETDEDIYDDEGETGYPNNMDYGRLNDYHDMPPRPPARETYIQSAEPVHYNRSLRVEENQVFQTKQELVNELGHKFMEEHFDYKITKSCRQRYEAKCKVSGCPWRIACGSVGELGGMFCVKKLVDKHTCSGTQVAQQAPKKKVLGNMLKERYGDASRQLRPKEIMVDMMQQYGYILTYHQAWRARCEALLLVRGSHGESYERLPMYLHNLALRNHGTRYWIKTDSVGRFESCFVSLGCAIRNFSNYLRPVLILDAGHLKGPYGGTMFLAVANDADNSIVPIAIGIGKSESTDDWTWFLSQLRECIGAPQDLVFMSDRAAAINAALTNVFPNNGHALCCRHLEMNAKSGDKRIRLYKGTYWKACRAYTEAEFERHMNALRISVPEAARVMDDAGKEKWSNAYFQGTRFDVMTSNSAESVNAVSRFARRLPIVSLLEFFRDFQQEWYLVRREKGEQMQNPLTPNAEDIIRKRAGRSMSWRIRGLQHNRKYEVGRDYNFAIVNMENNTCTCREWDKSGLPCGHAIVVARHHGPSDISHLAWNYFRSETFRKTYEETIWPAGPSTSWVFPEAPIMPCHAPLKDRNRVGRPANTNRRPSRGEAPIRRSCVRCGAAGHTTGECSIPAPSSMPRNRGSTSGTSYNYDLNLP